MDDSTMPLSEGGKLPQLYQVESGQAKFTKEDESVDVQASSKLIGLTKEQLEKYRNDPFWKPLRLIMFVLFWVAWIAMFAGAILIVVLSPKCVAKKEQEWWRTKVSYQVFTPTFRDSDGDGIGDFNGIREKLDEIRKIGVQNVWAAPVIATHKDDFQPFDVIDFGKVDERFGTMDDFKALIDAIHDRDMHFVMDLPISTTSSKHVWFQAAKAGGEYRDYYVWKKAADIAGEKDYVKMEGTDDAFLAYEGKDPVLNWENEKVKKAILAVAKQYLDYGVDGFHVAYVSQLMKNKGSAQYAKAALAALETFTAELETYIEGLEAMTAKKVVAVFTSLDDMQEVQPHDQEDYNVGSLEYVIDNSIKNLNSETCPDGIAACLQTALSSSLGHFERSKLPHVWQFTDYRVSRPTSRFDVPTGNLLTFVQLTLPGAVEIYYGQELGLSDAKNSTMKYTGLMQWDDTQHAGFSSAQPFFATTSDYSEVNFKTQFAQPRSMLKTFQKIARMRQRDENLALGAMKLAPLKNDVVMYSRIHRVGNGTVGPMYVVVANFATSDQSVGISSLLPADRSAQKAEVAAITPNVETYAPRQVIDLSATTVTLAPKQGLLLKIN